MTATTRTALAARLEAGETDRELDCLIARAVGWLNGYGEPPPLLEDIHDGSLYVFEALTESVPAYTTSLDACATATPEGWEIIGVARAWRGDERLYRAVLGHHGASRVARGWSTTMCGAWALAILDAADKGGES